MNNWELGNETRRLGWARCYLSRLPVQRLFWWFSTLGTVCGHCLESSSLHLSLKSIRMMLREATRPIHNNATDSCDGNICSRGWNNVIESLVIQEMALFPNIFHAPGRRDCSSLRLSHIPAVLLFESSFPPVAVLLHAEPAFHSAPARPSLKDCFHKVATRKWSRRWKICQ